MSFKDLNLLIVDDESDILEIYEDLFRSSVGKIFRATSGLEALEIMKTMRVDAIISDINMPGMSGLELLEKVRESNKSIPFVVVTGFGDKQGAIRALRLGAFDFIDKPFDMERMRSTISSALDSACQLKLLSGYLSRVVQVMNPEAEVVDRSEHLIARLSKKS